jgi:hypothetical protein
MKFQRCFSSPPAKLGNSIRSTPWGRYRHGCDPPISPVRFKCLNPHSTSHLFFIECPIHSIPRAFTDGMRIFQQFNFLWTRYSQVRQVVFLTLGVLNNEDVHVQISPE